MELLGIILTGLCLLAALPGAIQSIVWLWEYFNKKH
jgi:predicted Na+-dependent transporter